MMLTRDQFHFFRHNGFLKLPGRLPAAQVEELRQAVHTGIRDRVEPVVADRQGRIVRLSDIWSRGAPFQEAMTAPAVLDSLESLLGPNIELILNRHNHATLRLADDGSSYLHRDVLEWSRTIVTLLFYLEDTTVENGCTLIVPGSHLLPGFSRNTATESDWLVQSGLLDQAVPAPMQAGSVLAIDSMIVHGSGTNRTSGSRMSLTVGYHSVDELADGPNPKRVLVRGVRPYGGNDRY